MNDTLLNIIEIVLSILLVGLILLQTKGTGLGSAFGGDIAFYGTKRGAEKILFIATIVTAILFLTTSLISVMF
jgi:preprotein translocase subunit SecG